MQIDTFIYGGTIAGRGGVPVAVTAIPLPYTEGEPRRFFCLTADGTQNVHVLTQGDPKSIGTFWRPPAVAQIPQALGQPASVSRPA